MVFDIQNLLDRIALRSPSLIAVWLVGSRANGTANESSDWDFIAIGKPETLSFLRAATDLHHPDVDFLVVTNGDNFEAAWGKCEKRGSLAQWEWEQLDSNNAAYTQTKWEDAEDGAGVRSNRVSAKRIWP